MTINSATITPNEFPNGKTTSATITFNGEADDNDTEVKVTFTISPNPALKIEGKKSTTEDYTFSSTEKTYKATVKITNSNTPASTSWKNAKITIDGTVVSTGEKNGTKVALKYK